MIKEGRDSARISMPPQGSLLNWKDINAKELRWGA